MLWCVCRNPLDGRWGTLPRSLEGNGWRLVQHRLQVIALTSKAQRWSDMISNIGISLASLRVHIKSPIKQADVHLKIGGSFYSRGSMIAGLGVSMVVRSKYFKHLLIKGHSIQRNPAIYLSHLASACSEGNSHVPVESLNLCCT